MSKPLNYSSISCFSQRPSQKVRFLVERNLQKLIAISIKEIFQFANTSQTKLKAITQLKYSLLLGESYITPHTQHLIKSLVRISQMDLDNISKLLYQIVEIIGWHVSSSYYIPLMISILGHEQFRNNTKNTIILLNMFAFMLKNSEKLEQHTKDILKLLSHYQTVFYDNDEGLQAIFGIIEVIVQRISKFEDENVVSIAFSIILNIQATKTISQEVRNRALKLMEELASKSGFLNVSQLHSHEIRPILQRFIATKQYVNWSKTSKDRFKFDTIVRNCHGEVAKFLPEILQVMEYMINPQSEMQLRMDTLVLIEVLLREETIKEGLRPIAQQVMRKLLIPAIQWKVGKPQIKIRKAGVIDMILLIENGIISEEQLRDSYSELLPQLKNCLNDDWAPELRLVSCELVEKYLTATKQVIDTDQLRELYPLLLERLDDSQDPIRKKIATAINVFFSCRYIKLTESTLEYMIGAIFVHFDDNSEEIQDAIFTSLKFAANVNPQLVLKTAESNIKKMKHTQKCKELIEFCKELIEDRMQEE